MAKKKPKKKVRIRPLDDRVVVKPLEGDIVLFAKFGGTEVQVEGEELMIMRESDLLALIKE